MENKKDRRSLNELWDTRLAEFSASGKSVPEWCKEHGIPAHQLRYRLQKQRGKEEASVESEKTRWAAISNTTQALSSGISLRVGSVNIDVQRGFDPAVLSDVLRSLLKEC